MGHFKKKSRECFNCKSKWTAHEEKETDVSIGITLLNDAHKGRFDRAYLVTRDSDLTPAVKMVRAEFPKKEIPTVAPPFMAHSQDLLKSLQFQKENQCRTGAGLPISKDRPKSRRIGRCYAAYQIRLNTSPSAPCARPTHGPLDAAFNGLRQLGDIGGDAPGFVACGANASAPNRPLIDLVARERGEGRYVNPLFLCSR
jgi:hypothetical protein